MIETLIGRPRHPHPGKEFLSAPALQREFRVSPTALKTAALRGRVASKPLELVAEITVFNRADVAACFPKRDKPLERRRGKK